ncbi:MAG: hypothetical protein IJ530_00945 [Treponema sp.]|uniref:ParB/Srx family N-terminal domain-containing protein n=1 Tax=Treponema sp. TaxID=166 RepID=UPI0025F88918|nr:ParB/Srx family N-terminal domain-containing protein [Treponema sp.]MBQ8678311.1 hypothetical protein [Treponema sp.]
MAKTLSIITNGNKGGLPVQNAGLKLSKIIALDRIEEHEKFRELYSIDDDLLDRITEDMRRNRFDESQPVHIWLKTDGDGAEHFYLIDGYTRVKAARLAGLLTVPYFEHHFDSFEEAHRYALHIQVDRRNLDDSDFLKNVELLMGSEYIRNFEGNRNAAIGRLLGKSEKTIERANFVEKNATEEQRAEIESGEATINKTYNDIKKQQFVDKNASEEQKARIESGEATTEEIYSELKENEAKEPSSPNESIPDRHVSVDEESDSDLDAFDDISESLSDTSGNPKGIVIGDHSDHIERPTNKLSPEEDSERTKERRKAYELGFEEGFHNALVFALAETSNGKTIHQIWNDERIRNLKKRCDFKLPNGYEEMVSDWWYDDDSEPSDTEDETNASDSEDAPDGSSGGITPDIDFSEEE